MRKTACLLIFLAVLLANSSATAQKFEPTIASMRQAIAQGQAKEFLTAMEAMGSEAERQKWLLTPIFPLYFWAPFILVGEGK